MAKYRHALPKPQTRHYLSGGNPGSQISHIAAFELLQNDGGRIALIKQYEQQIQRASHFRGSLVLEAPTWRAHRQQTGHSNLSSEQLAELNRRAVSMMEDLRERFETRSRVMPISGSIGPRHGAYRARTCMSADDARRFHREQIQVLSDTATDLLCAFDLHYVEEAIGIVLAAKDFDMPVVVSFNTDATDHLPCGLWLQDALLLTNAATNNRASYFQPERYEPTEMPVFGKLALA